MINEPTVEVTCDKCGHNHAYSMTPLARQSWDLRDLDRQLKRDLWKVDGDTHICESCQLEEEEQ